ncbi:MAG TPA: hypothetical protein VLD59_03645 [Steroidobacteraceae bacterium]|nr:hypothetical protein [Steroidobacteraceae bacterium]
MRSSRPALTVLVTVFVTMVALAACASSGRLLQSWKDPSVKKLDFEKVVAIALVEDGPTRRLAESEMARIIGPDAVPGSQVLPAEELRDIDKVKSRLKEGGFDGAITMRLVDAETEIRDEQDPLPTAYYTIWGYYGFVSIAERGPAYMTLDSKLQIEVNIYSLDSEKLLWSGTTETMQPRLMETLVKDVADLVSKRLKREGLLSASPAAT